MSSLRNSPYYRKRTRSIESIDESERKRLRRFSTLPLDDGASSSMPSIAPSRGGSQTGLSLERSFSQDLSGRLEQSPRRPRMSASASFLYSASLSSRASSMSIDDDGFRHALVRSASSTDLRRKRESMGPGADIPTFKEHSAYHVLRSVNNVDYTVPTTTDTTEATAGSPIGWSHSNALVFGRGNRVYYKSMTDTEGVAQQLCKMTDNMGSLALVQCAGEKYPNMVALATSNGHMQLWDLATKRPTLQWKMKAPSAMTFNGTTLTVGDEKGALRHFDTRISEPAKLKDQATKVTRHQGRITTLAWHRDKFTVASGDQNGLILVWDIRKPRVPLEVGELVQRRRKMQHIGTITALAWCPWYGKYLVSGDSAADKTGTIRVWDIANDHGPNSSSRPSERPTKLEFDAQITSLHFSPHINELLSTHGSGKPTEVPSLTRADPLQARMANSIVVHQFPLMRHVTTVSVATKTIAGSVLSPNGHRIVLAVPEESQLKVWDVWGKFKAPKQKSLFESCAIR